MGAPSLQPETLEERLVYLTILSTWVFWLMGALYVVGPVLGLTLGALVVGRRFGIGDQSSVARAWRRLTWTLRAWLIGMGLMYVALVVAHVSEGIGIDVLFKSSVGWAKGWLLLALFPIAGALLQIRAAIVIRAIGILAIQALCLMPFFVAAPYIGLPELLYVSPLMHLGGPSPEFFDVTLHDTDVITGRYRWRFFSPWATLAALYAILWLLMLTAERKAMFKWFGVLSALLICLLSQSRLAFVAVPLTLGVIFFLGQMSRPWVWIVAAVSSAAILLFSDHVQQVYEAFSDEFRGARAASSAVRDKLAAIALHRWRSEAPIFGHGILERGPYIVHHMLIGSHHTWVGLLYVKGALGFIALAVPMALTAVALMARSVMDRLARVAFALLCAIFLGSFGDNLEVTVYIIWPALLIIGIVLGRRVRLPIVANTWHAFSAERETSSHTPGAQPA